MRGFRFAVRSLLRQPGRTALGIIGVAAVGALLFDMLLLSRGLVVSFRDLLDAFGFDVRVTATGAPPLAGPPIAGADAAIAAMAALDEVDEVVAMRVARAETIDGAGEPVVLTLVGADPGRRRAWDVVSGSDLADGSPAGAPGVLVSRHVAEHFSLIAGGQLVLRGVCSSSESVVPAVVFEISGIAEFPFESGSDLTVAVDRASFARTCGEPAEQAGEADMLLVASHDAFGPDAAVAALTRLRPDLHAFSNDDLVATFERTNFSYFRQISVVLSTITLFFGFLLITVLLTVSVNQRVGEIAGLRAIGLSRARVVSTIVWESLLVVGAGGLLALPLGLAMARWLDGILRSMPGLPEGLHFFVYEPRALATYGGLVVLTALLAALYPAVLVARLPIATTLRNEAVS